MKRYTLLVALAVVVVAGCGHRDDTVITGPDGSKMTISKDAGGATSGTMTINGVGADGTKVTETVNGDAGAKIDVTGKDGATYSQTSNAACTTIQGTDDKGNKVNETMGAKAVSEADLGVPFYPGSEESKDAGLTMISRGPTGNTAMSSRVSKDAPSKVIDFYKDKIPGGKTASMTVGEGSMSSISGKLANGAQVSVTATNDGKKDTVVMVSATTPKS